MLPSISNVLALKLGENTGSYKIRFLLNHWRSLISGVSIISFKFPTANIQNGGGITLSKIEKHDF
jgi:hypothetical protein